METDYIYMTMYLICSHGTCRALITQQWRVERHSMTEYLLCIESIGVSHDGTQTE